MSAARRRRGAVSIALVVVFAAWLWLQPGPPVPSLVSAVTGALALALGLATWAVRRRLRGWPFLLYWFGMLVVPTAMLLRMAPGPVVAARYFFTVLATMGIAAIWLGPLKRPRPGRPGPSARSPQGSTPA